MKYKKNIYPRIYTILLLVAVVMLLFSVYYLKTDSYERYTSGYCDAYTGYRVVEQEEVLRLEIALPEDVATDLAMGFYTHHSAVKAEVEGEMIYSFDVVEEQKGKTSPAYRINVISGLYQYRGQTIELEIENVYGDTEIPKFYLGDTLGIYRQYEYSEMGSILLCLITGTVGIILILVWCSFRGRVAYSLLYLGIFAINVAIYNANENSIFGFMINNGSYRMYLALLSLATMPIPFVLFLKELYHHQGRKTWDVCLALMECNLGVQMLLQVCGIVDMHDMLIITHLTFVVMFLIIIWETAYELKHYKISKSMKFNCICIVLVVICLLVDMGRYYASSGMVTSYTANFAFLCYVMVVGVQVIAENRVLLEKGKKASAYEKMAYTDKLTGLGNRMRHDKLLEEADTVNHNYMVCMFDLNNLKICNDTLGHTAGDEYICSAAEILKDSFGEVRDEICRIGGDEFCIVLRDEKMEGYECAIAKMQMLCRRYNAMDHPVKIGIAYGYAVFNEELDSSLIETRSRADSMMYEKKFELKKCKEA